MERTIRLIAVLSLVALLVIVGLVTTGYQAENDYGYNPHSHRPPRPTAITQRPESDATLPPSLDDLSPDPPNALSWPLNDTNIARALTFFLPDEQLLREQTDRAAWNQLHYDGPGIARYEGQYPGAFIFIAVHNESPWEIAGFRVRVTVQLAAKGAAELDCDSQIFNPYPGLTVLPPSQTSISHCRLPPNVPINDLVSAIHAAPLSAQLRELVLVAPNVTIVYAGDTASPRFRVDPNYGSIPQPEPESAPAASAAADDSGPAADEGGPSRALYKFFNANAPLLPILIGFLLGLGIGGLARRPSRPGAVSGGVVLLGLLGFLVWCLITVQGHDSPELRGNGYMLLIAFTVYGVVGYALFLGGLALGVAGMSALRKVA